MSPRALVTAFLKGEPETAIIDELSRRTRGVLPCGRDGTVDPTVSVKFIEMMKSLIEHKVSYAGDRYENLKLYSITEILSRPTTTLVHEPWNGRPIFDGKDPSNGMTYPTDPAQFQLLCFVVKNLPRMMGSDYNPHNLELQEAVNEQIAVGGRPKANVRALIMEYNEASDEDKKAALQLSTTEYWDRFRQSGRTALEPFPKKTVETEETPPPPPPPPTAGQKPIKIVCVCSTADARFKRELQKYFATDIRAGKVTFWSRQDLPPGSPVEYEIRKRVEEANIILYVLSGDFYADPDTMNTIQTYRQYAPISAHIGIRARPCIADDTGPLGVLLPKGEKYVSSDIEGLSLEVVRSIQRMYS